MTDEELNSLFSELAKDETSIERKAEVVNELKSAYQEKDTKYNELVENTSKLQEDYKKLQAKKVDEFFNAGTPIKEEVKTPAKEELPTFDEIVDDMLKGV